MTATIDSGSRPDSEGRSPTAALEMVKLLPLMEIASGRQDIRIGLIDGPVALSHPELAAERIQEIPGTLPGACSRPSSAACLHGTFVAGMLVAKRGSPAPAICPDCTLVVRPIFTEATAGNGQMPGAPAEDLAAAIVDCIEAGARVLNLSVGLAPPSAGGEAKLEEALDHAARRSVIIVAAAGNEGTIGSSPITGHRWVIPVVASDLRGRPTSQSNLASSIGRRGLRAPGHEITSLGAEGKPLTLGGTSAAAPFVTGAIALLWSEFPAAKGAEVRSAVLLANGARRPMLVPPLLDAWAAYQSMVTAHRARGMP